MGKELLNLEEIGEYMNKYELLSGEQVFVVRNGDESITAVMYRVKALTDIPRYGVKAGDVGGYVSSSSILSHNGDCWIGGNAKVYGNVNVAGNALITGEAKVAAVHTVNKVLLAVTGDAIIRGNAVVIQKRVLNYDICLVTDTAEIYENAVVVSPQVIAGNSRIYGYARIESFCSILGNTRVGGNAVLSGNVISDGDIRIFQDACIGEYVELGGETIVAGETQIAPHSKIMNRTYPKYPESPIVEVFTEDPNADYLNKPNRNLYPLNYNGSIAHIEIVMAERSVRAPAQSITGIYSELLAELRAKVEEYHNDVINLLRYPVMSDMTNDFTRDMATAMRKAERAEKFGTPDEFKDAVLKFEEKFLAAESNARKIAATGLSDEERKKTETAKQMFAMAVNEASAEHEKKTALKRGFKELEGILHIPDAAVQSLITKAGLLELEA